MYISFYLCVTLLIYSIQNIHLLVRTAFQRLDKMADRKLIMISYLLHGPDGNWIQFERKKFKTKAVKTYGCESESESESDEPFSNLIMHNVAGNEGAFSLGSSKKKSKTLLQTEKSSTANPSDGKPSTRSIPAAGSGWKLELQVHMTPRFLSIIDSDPNNVPEVSSLEKCAAMILYTKYVLRNVYCMF